MRFVCGLLCCQWHSQLALQSQQERIHVVRSNREARKRPTKSNGTPAMDLGQMNFVLKWCICMLVAVADLDIVIIIIMIITIIIMCCFLVLFYVNILEYDLFVCLFVCMFVCLSAKPPHSYPPQAVKKTTSENLWPRIYSN